MIQNGDTHEYLVYHSSIPKDKQYRNSVLINLRVIRLIRSLEKVTETN